jgi:chromosome segregation ATPase
MGKADQAKCVADEDAFTAVLGSLPKCVTFLRQWADKLEKRYQDFASSEKDLSELVTHTEQLSVEIEKSRPNAPVYKNAQDALRKAVSRTGKVLKELQLQLEQTKADLLPTDQFRDTFEFADQKLEECTSYVEEYREGCKSLEATEATSGTSVPNTVSSKEKKLHKEKKRSTSPKRPREKTASLMA